MASETRVVLVKPGDVLVFGNLGTLDLESLAPRLAALKDQLGLAHILLFQADIDMALVSADA